MANFMIHSMAAGMLRKELPETDGIGTAATYTAGALLVDVAVFRVGLHEDEEQSVEG